MRGRLAPLLVCVTVAAACSTGREDVPTLTDTGGRDAASLIPEAPTPSPTPTPTPLPEGPLPDRTGGGSEAVGETVGSCGSPKPPPVTRFRINVHQSYGGGAMLDATPLVGPDFDYCRLLGYTDGRLYCAVRPEGHPERLACEALAIGRAADTGRVGPTWSVNGHACHGQTGGASCGNHPTNQFLVLTWGGGTYRACSAGGVCSDLLLP